MSAFFLDKLPDIIYNNHIKISKKMSETPLYRIEEYQTSLWQVPFENCTNLTKDQAKVRFEELVNHESLNPNRLRVVREA